MIVARPKFGHSFSALVLSILLGGLIPEARSASLDPAEFQNAAALLVESTVAAVIKTVGLSGEFRPILGATPPGGLSGTNLGLVVHVSETPSEFTDALVAAGYNKPPFSSLPAGHIILQQRLASFWTIGLGYLKYDDFKLMGANTQFSWETDEGPSFALRVNYSKNELGFVKTQTWSPRLVASKPLLFFEPFVGVGYTSTQGTLTIPLTIAGQAVTVNAKGAVSAFNAFGGLILNLAALSIAFEGTYSTTGINGVGAQFALRL